MGELLPQIIRLIESDKVVISDHGYEELSADNIFVDDALKGIYTAKVIEEYLDYGKGPCVLVLEVDEQRKPIHVVWGIPKGRSEPAVLVTAYRPDDNLWDHSHTMRIK